MPAVLKNSKVEADHVALLQGDFVRNAVHDNVVDGDASRSRVVAVAKEAWYSPFFADQPVGKLVQLARRHSRCDLLRNEPQSPSHDAARFSHFRNLGFALKVG